MFPLMKAAAEDGGAAPLPVPPLALSAAPPAAADEGKQALLSPEGVNSSASTRLAEDTVGEQLTPSRSTARPSSRAEAEGPRQQVSLLGGQSRTVSRTMLGDLGAAPEVVRVLVTSCSRGCITGRLAASSMGDEDVTFTLLEIKPGYLVVGEVLQGPAAFKKACWKLKRINGQADVDASVCLPNDLLVFEGPRWATSDRRARPSLGSVMMPVLPPARGSSQFEGFDDAVPIEVPRIVPMGVFPQRPSCRKEGGEADRGRQSVGGAGQERGGSRKPLWASRSWSPSQRRAQERARAQKTPPVPKLDLAGVHGEKPRGQVCDAAICKIELLPHPVERSIDPNEHVCQTGMQECVLM